MMESRWDTEWAFRLHNIFALIRLTPFACPLRVRFLTVEWGQTNGERQGSEFRVYAVRRGAFSRAA